MLSQLCGVSHWRGLYQTGINPADDPCSFDLAKRLLVCASICVPLPLWLK